MLFEILGNDKNNLYCRDYYENKYFLLDWKYDIHNKKLNLSASRDVNIKKQINKININSLESKTIIKNIILFKNEIHCIIKESDNSSNQFFLYNNSNKKCIMRQSFDIYSNNIHFSNNYFSENNFIIPNFYSDKIINIDYEITNKENTTLYNYKFDAICNCDIQCFKIISENEFLVLTYEKEIIIFHIDDKNISEIKKINLQKLVFKNVVNYIIDIVYTNNKIIVFLCEIMISRKGKRLGNKFTYLVIYLKESIVSRHELTDKPRRMIKLSEEIILIIYNKIFSQRQNQYDIIYFPDIKYFKTQNKNYFSNQDIYLHFE